MIERKHIIIGLVLFFLFAGAAASQGLPSGWPPLTKGQRIVALTLLGEARGEGAIGMYAVGCVIEKRSANRNLTLAQVCREGRQFSCWNKGGEKHMDLVGRILKADTKEAKYAKTLARAMTAGDLEQSYTSYADHYCTLATKPSWSYKIIKEGNKEIKISIKPVKIIGQHKFYKLK